MSLTRRALKAPLKGELSPTATEGSRGVRETSPPLARSPSLFRGGFKARYSLTLGEENDKIFTSECRVMQTLK